MNSNGRSEAERERARIERERRRAAERGEPLPPLPPPAADPPPAAAEPPQSAAPPPVTRAAATPPTWDDPQERQKFDPPPPRKSPKDSLDGASSDAPLNARRLTVIAAGIALLVFVWFLFSVFQPFAGDGKGSGKVEVTIPKGASVDQIGELLATKSVVASARKFGWRAGWSGKSDDFKAGRYVLGEGMSYSAAIDQLATGPNAGTTIVTIPEGRSRYEIAQQVSASGLQGDYMAATVSSELLNPRRYGAPKSVNDLEGFLFPATYELPAGANVDKLVPQQLTAFKNNIAEVNLRFARSKNLTVYDVLTIASLIEREVSVASERKLVSAVIYNRLKQGVALGIDATTRFETRNWTEPLTNSQLQNDTPFNTRTNKGLPPGPIGNPGLASIKAAANPSSVKYLYYVANPCKPGTHAFSESYEEFQQNVQRYNDARDKAGGKQPSDC